MWGRVADEGGFGRIRKRNWGDFDNNALYEIL